MRNCWPGESARAGASSWCDVRPVEKHQSVRLLAHARLTVASPDPTLIMLHRRVRIPPPAAVFTHKAIPAQQPRENRGGGNDPVLVQQPSGEFGLGDGRLVLDRLDREVS
jgi:hypothetical protein